MITRVGTIQPRSVSDLANETGLEPYVVAGVLLNLGNRGLVRRIDQKRERLGNLPRLRGSPARRTASAETAWRVRPYVAPAMVAAGFVAAAVFFLHGDNRLGSKVPGTSSVDPVAKGSEVKPLIDDTPPRKNVKATSFWVPEVARLYDFPTEFDGKGQTIGLIELGGGYTDEDLDAYFAQLNLAKPKVRSVSVAGSKNRRDSMPMRGHPRHRGRRRGRPSCRNRGLFCPNTNEGFIDAVNAAVTDMINRPSVLSITWGSPESVWPNDMMNTMTDTLKEFATLGTTVVTAAGNQGVTDGITDGKGHVTFPASSPFVLAVGGTRRSGLGAQSLRKSCGTIPVGRRPGVA